MGNEAFLRQQVWAVIDSMNRHLDDPDEFEICRHDFAMLRNLLTNALGKRQEGE